MKRLIWSTALAAALALAGSGTAAALTCGSALSDDSCKDTRKCADEIQNQAIKYAAALQGQIRKNQAAGLDGKNSTKADGGKICVGGTRHGKTCVSNGGKCKDGARKNLACDDGDDCPGVCKEGTTVTAFTCTANSDCISVHGLTAAARCNGFGKGCDSGAGCDTGKCEVKNFGAIGIAAQFQLAAKNLKNNIGKKCTLTMLDDLGYPNARCKGKCSVDANRCSSDADCAAGAADSCIMDVSGASATTADDMDVLASCIQQASVGDILNAKAGDAISSPLSKVSALGMPEGAKTNKTPRRRSTVSLPNLIQIAVKSTEDGAGSAGGSSPTGLARCVNAGPRTGNPCIEDGECQSVPALYPSATCEADCCYCSGAAPGATCSSGPADATGSVSSSTLELCTAAGDLVCDTRGNQGNVGNLLNAPTENASNGISTCLVTSTTRVKTSKVDALDFESGDKGHCALGGTCSPSGFTPALGYCMFDQDCDTGDTCMRTACDTDADCGANAPCKGGLASAGGVNLTTGDGSGHAPISTEVFLVSGTPGATCPRCDPYTDPANPTCAEGENTGGSCNSKDGGTDTACPPDTTSGSWSSLGSIPNPFDLTSGKAQKTASTSVGANGGWPAGSAYCGRCTGTATTIGCQVNTDCPGVETCTYTDAYAGFRGSINYDDDVETTGKQATAQGVAGLFTATQAGLFCTGKTGGLPDSSVGLPGPVRVVQPVIVNWTFSTK